MNNFAAKILGVAGVIAFGGISAMPAHAASATGDATVKVMSGLAVSKTSDLNFGRLVPGSGTETLTVAADGTVTCGGTLTCFGTKTPGNFSVTGAAGEVVTVQIANSAITLSNGSYTMPVSLSTPANSMTLSVDGTGSFKVGGVLTVASTQAPGTYTGQYSVSVNYQ